MLLAYKHCISHDWKKPENKHAYTWSRTGMGGWAVAQRPIMITTVTLERLHKRGYEAMLDYYLKVSPQL
jgi:hypothetical protein